MRERRGAEVGLPAHRLVAVDRARAARAERREAVVLGGDLDAPGLQVLDGVVGAAVAEGQLEGLQADRAAEQLVAEADAPHGLAADELAHRLDDVARAPPGRRGRWRGRPRRGPPRAAPRRELVHGCSDTRAPRATSSRTIEALMPVSITAIRGPSPAPWRLTSRGVTSPARSCPAIGGSASISSRASPRRSPPGRRRRASRRPRGCACTSARVSTPLIAGHAAVGQPVEPAALGRGRVLAVARLAHDRRARPRAL